MSAGYDQGILKTTSGAGLGPHNIPGQNRIRLECLRIGHLREPGDQHRRRCVEGERSNNSYHNERSAPCYVEIQEHEIYKKTTVLNKTSSESRVVTELIVNALKTKHRCDFSTHGCLNSASEVRTRELPMVRYWGLTLSMQCTRLSAESRY